MDIQQQQQQQQTYHNWVIEDEIQFTKFFFSDLVDLKYKIKMFFFFLLQLSIIASEWAIKIFLILFTVLVRYWWISIVWTVYLYEKRVGSFSLVLSAFGNVKFRIDKKLLTFNLWAKFIFIYCHLTIVE